MPYDFLQSPCRRNVQARRFSAVSCRRSARRSYAVSLQKECPTLQAECHTIFCKVPAGAMHDDFLQCNVPASGMPDDFEHYSVKRHPGAPWVVEKASLGSSKGALGVQKDSWGVPGEPKVVSKGSPEGQGGASGRPWDPQGRPWGRHGDLKSNPGTPWASPGAPRGIPSKSE